MTKLARTLEATCELKAHLDASHCQLEIAYSNSQRKISTLIENHTHDLDVVHVAHAAQAVEHENRDTVLLKLQVEVELTNQAHVVELASLQATIEHLRALTHVSPSRTYVIRLMLPSDHAAMIHVGFTKCRAVLVACADKRRASICNGCLSR